MNLPEFLTEWPFGQIVLTGHRIGLYHVVDDYKHGYTPERIHEDFPTLPLDLINKVLAFYKENQAEVDAYMARCEEESERVRRASKPIDWEELKRRMRAMGRLKDEG